MLTIEKKNRYTADDYLLLEEGAPFQLINYDLVMSPSPAFNHQIILGEFYDIFKSYLKQSDNQGVLVLSPIDVQFDEGNVLQPDLLYITADRKDEIIKDRIEGAPDLIVEILSPSNAYYDLRQKKDIYEKFGVKEYIIVDPIAQNADLYLLKDGQYALNQRASKNETLNSLLLPGFGIELSKLFK